MVPRCWNYEIQYLYGVSNNWKLSIKTRNFFLVFCFALLYHGRKYRSKLKLGDTDLSFCSLTVSLFSFNPYTLQKLSDFRHDISHTGSLLIMSDLPFTRTEIVSLVVRLTLVSAVTFWSIKWLLNQVDPTSTSKKKARKVAEEQLRRYGRLLW